MHFFCEQRQKNHRLHRLDFWTACCFSFETYGCEHFAEFGVGDEERSGRRLKTSVDQNSNENRAAHLTRREVRRNGRHEWPLVGLKILKTKCARIFWLAIAVSTNKPVSSASASGMFTSTLVALLLRRFRRGFVKKDRGRGDLDGGERLAAVVVVVAIVELFGVDFCFSTVVDVLVARRIVVKLDNVEVLKSSFSDAAASDFLLTSSKYSSLFSALLRGSLARDSLPSPLASIDDASSRGIARLVAFFFATAFAFTLADFDTAAAAAGARVDDRGFGGGLEVVGGARVRGSSCSGSTS